MTIQAWYMDDKEGDQRAPHRREPNAPVSVEDLKKLGILTWNLNAEIFENDPILKEIRKERGYSYSDVITCCPEKLPNYEQKLKSFYEEHLHTDEEIRYCLEGSGYFDVRDDKDEWIRIRLEKGDMITLPEGIYHRFTLDSNNYIKAMRLFVGDPIWTPHNRPQKDHPSRKKYIESIGSGVMETAA